MGEDLKREILEHLKFLKEVIISSSPLALIFGGIWFLIYSIRVVKDFPQSIEVSFFYQIFVIFIYLIISIISPLIFHIYFKIVKEHNLERENGNNLMNKLARRIESIYFLITYIIVNLILLCVSLYIEYKISKLSIWFWFILLLFIIVQFFLYLITKDYLKRIIIDKDKNALFSFIIYVPIIVTIIYINILLIAPFYILKFGYFEASLTLDKEYVEQTELYEIYTEKCLDKPYEEKNKTQEQQKEKNETQKLQEQSDSSNKNNQSQDIQNQNNKYYRTFKFFIFLRTGSEYIVGCSKNPNVRIHIPSDKVIAIEY